VTSGKEGAPGTAFKTSADTAEAGARAGAVPRAMPAACLRACRSALNWFILSGCHFIAPRTRVRSAPPVITAIILINVERAKVNAVAEQLAEMQEISEVFSVSGNYDLVAVVRVAFNDALAELVTNHLQKIQGIEQTNTMLAFKAYSRHDLDAMFSMGDPRD
jgi:DNA-binding Lrp family transcriptional regulator